MAQSSYEFQSISLQAGDDLLSQVYLYGNFLVMSTKLWKDIHVQDWITLCIVSGGMERHR
jgi:hypothetical protein